MHNGLTLVILIGACEIAFWVALVVGLLFRYPFRMKRTGGVILFLIPVIDLVLVVTMSVDLARGTQATELHGLAAAYLGFSIAFGHSVIQWLDAKFAHRFAGAPKPQKPPKFGHPDRTRREWRDWRRYVLAWAIACVVILAMMFIVSTPAATRNMWIAWIPRLTGIGIAWFLLGPIWAWSYEKWPPRSKRAEVAAMQESAKLQATRES